MRLLITTLFALTLFGCEKASEAEPFEPVSINWQLEAIYFDPGGGTVDFEPVESDRYLRFESGRVFSNGSLCYLSDTVAAERDAAYDAIAQRILAEDCDGGESVQLPYNMTDNLEYLIVSGPYCIEPCLYRFKRPEGE